MSGLQWWWDATELLALRTHVGVGACTYRLHGCSTLAVTSFLRQTSWGLLGCEGFVTRRQTAIVQPNDNRSTFAST